MIAGAIGLIFVLDTNAVIDILRNQFGVAERLARQSPQAIGITSMTFAELQFGVLNGAHPEREQYVVDRLVRLAIVLSFNRKAALVHAQLRYQLRSHQIGTQDLIIASTALANNATLVTSNTREFERVPGLRIENWRE